MLVAQDSGKMVLLTQQVKKETLAHDQVDINKWLMWCPDNCPGKPPPPSPTPGQQTTASEDSCT